MESGLPLYQSTITPSTSLMLMKNTFEDELGSIIRINTHQPTCLLYAKLKWHQWTKQAHSLLSHKRSSYEWISWFPVATEDACTADSSTDLSLMILMPYHPSGDTSDRLTKLEHSLRLSTASIKIQDTYSEESQNLTFSLNTLSNKWTQIFGGEIFFKENYSELPRRNMIHSRFSNLKKILQIYFDEVDIDRRDVLSQETSYLSWGERINIYEKKKNEIKRQSWSLLPWIQPLWER